MTLLSLPGPALDAIASSLDVKTSKSLAVAHRDLTEVSERRLWNTLHLPLRNSTGEHRLLESLNYLSKILRRRIRHVRELHIDLTHRYHHAESDLDAVDWAGIYGHPFESSWDDQTTLDLARKHVAEMRKGESPANDKELREAFERFPVLPGVINLTVTVYESFESFLPCLLRIVPNLRHIIIIPHSLLVESPLHFAADIDSRLPFLRSATFSPMIPALLRLSTLLVEGTTYLGSLRQTKVVRGDEGILETRLRLS